MVQFTLESDSLEEIGDELARHGIVSQLSEEWQADVAVLEAVLDAVRESTEMTDGRGNQQSKIAEIAGLDEEYQSQQVGTLLDALVVLGRVEKRERRYVLADDE